MRCFSAIAVALLLMYPAMTGQAAAEPPPAPPGLPALPSLPDLFPQLMDVPLPNAPAPLHELIDQVIPPPPIAAAPIEPSPVWEATGAPAPVLALRAAVRPENVGDPIFDAWPANLADLALGEVIEVRDVTATTAPLLVLPIQRAQLLKYRTTDANGNPSFATATLVVPVAAWPGPGPRPVVVNNLPIDALGRVCTPGYTLAHGLNSETSVTDFIPPTTHVAALRGYAVLIPDHEGPWMAYAEPVTAGHAVLDAIRAVRALLPEEFGARRGGGPGGWGGALAPRGAGERVAGEAPGRAAGLVGGARG
ncbi:lipase family protein, partial [Nocardia brasiliensis]|uniref:lipase family protein n=1 Tax=Nocardia brasiliensis TaxID=37326 RepID=UPI0024563448